jgi:hypothetical protein
MLSCFPPGESFSHRHSGVSRHSLTHRPRPDHPLSVTSVTSEYGWGQVKWSNSGHSFWGQVEYWAVETSKAVTGIDRKDVRDSYNWSSAAVIIPDFRAKPVEGDESTAAEESLNTAVTAIISPNSIAN